MDRIVRRELLDDLPADSPEAKHSRRDLVRVNAWMGNSRIAIHEIEKMPLKGPVKMADLGGGDGAQMLRILKGLPCRAGDLVIVDRQSLLTDAESFRELGWEVRVETADVFEWAARSGEVFDLVFANLFLHHFSDPQLQTLFRLMSGKTRAFLAIEPRRGALVSAMSKLLWLIGCNHVTRHDARLSIQAGFSGNDLLALWDDNSEWVVREYEGGLSSHVFAAIKRQS